MVNVSETLAVLGVTGCTRPYLGYRFSIGSVIGGNSFFFLKSVGGNSFFFLKSVQSYGKLVRVYAPETLAVFGVTRYARCYLGDLFFSWTDLEGLGKR